MGAHFKFKRDPSRDNKYVCVCSTTFPNPYSLRYHVEGVPNKSRAPCHLILAKAIEVVNENIVCDDETKPINYEPSIPPPSQATPSREDRHVEVMSEMDVDENDLPDLNLDPDESVHSEHESQVDHELDLNDSNADLRRILEDHHIALNNAINQLQDAQAASNAFSVKIPSTHTVDDLKKLIKVEIPDTFNGLDAKDLTLWRVSIPDEDDNDEENPILVNSVTTADKKKLRATHELSDVFPDKPPKNTIHILVQRPLVAPSDDLNPEVAALRERLEQLEHFKAEVLESSISIDISIWPERKFAFTWSTEIETATLDDLKKQLYEYDSHYANDDYLKIYLCNNGHANAEAIIDDECLRKLLRIAKTTCKTTLKTGPKIKWSISLATPSKNYSKWTFKDVCAEYGITSNPEPKIAEMPPFPEVRAEEMDTELRREMLDQVLREVDARVRILRLVGANEFTRSIVVSSFLVAATRLFHEDLYLEAQRELSGRRGHGPVDYSVHAVKDPTFTLGVTEVKKENFNQGLAQNIVQLESALTAKKRKREAYEVDGEEEPPRKLRSYGVVTDASEWLFVECTMDEDESVSYRVAELPEQLNFKKEWREDAKTVFGKLVWLWTRMRDEIPSRDSYARKLLSSPSNKRIATGGPVCE
ncbi:hypothetical protein BGZ89_011018 [Linnemannia elongata]|nr:hypothetical protein BGZ89_011018 [Linnemannia elongata]